MLPEKQAPVCLIEIRPLGQLIVNPEALKFLSQIANRVVVVAIVGPCNTGKSHLMNRVARKETGFFLGTTGNQRTKGIWMWCMPHPENQTIQLVLLDTEGLDKDKNCDERNNMWILILSLLSSNIMIYNSMDTIDYWDMKNLSYSIQLAELTKEKSSGGKFNSTNFFIWTLQGNRLIINGKSIIPDDYLGSVLTVKPDIRERFPNYKCYMFERPMDAMNNMELLSEMKPTPGFVKMARTFVDYIFMIAQSKRIVDSCAENGEMLATLLTTYIEKLNTDVLYKRSHDSLMSAIKCSAEDEREEMKRVTEKTSRVRDQWEKEQNVKRDVNIAKILANKAEERKRIKERNVTGTKEREGQIVPVIRLAEKMYYHCGIIVLALILVALVASGILMFIQANQGKLEWVERGNAMQCQAQEHLVQENRLREERIKQMEADLEDANKSIEEKEAVASKLEEQQLSLKQEFQEMSAAMERQIRVLSQKAEVLEGAREENIRVHQKTIEENRQRLESIRILEAVLEEDKKKSLEMQKSMAVQLQEQERSLRQDFQKKAAEIEMQKRAQNQKAELEERVREEEFRAHHQLIEKNRINEGKIRMLEMDLEEQKKKLLAEKETTNRKLQEHQATAESCGGATQEKRAMVESTRNGDESHAKQELIEENRQKDEKIQQLEASLKEQKEAKYFNMQEQPRSQSEEFQEMASDKDSGLSYVPYRIGLIALLIWLHGLLFQGKRQPRRIQKNLLNLVHELLCRLNETDLMSESRKHEFTMQVSKLRMNDPHVYSLKVTRVCYSN